MSVTYIYVCSSCGIEMFSNQSFQEVGLVETTLCMQCNVRNIFRYVGSVEAKEKRYLFFGLNVAFWRFMMKIGLIKK